MKRQGNCNRCGKCCSFDGLVESETSLIAKVAKQAGATIDEIKAAIRFDCPKLLKSGSVCFCRDYENRPDFCKQYPAEPADLVAGCGFSFNGSC